MIGEAGESARARSADFNASESLRRLNNDRPSS